MPSSWNRLFLFLIAAMSAALFALPTGLLKTSAVSALYARTFGLRAQQGAMTAPSSRSYGDLATKSLFTYRLGAAASPKRAPSRPAKLGQDYWVYASTNAGARPPYLRSTKRDSGEDAFFATTIAGSAHDVAFGVADGVGGWQDQGIDPSHFSHGLCGLMAGTAFAHEGLEEGKTVRPQPLMQTAYDAVISNPRIVAGGCTASIGVANSDGVLESANLGDSGLLILAPGKIAYRSEPQTHAFNTPFQLAKIPQKMQAQNAIFGGSTHFSETPKDADVEKHKLRHGDIVIFATDGVWDNLSAQDTQVVVTKIMEKHGFWFKSHNFAGAELMINGSLVSSISQTTGGLQDEQFLPALLATAIMREAKVAGLNTKRNGPFAKEVHARYPHEGWAGGKADDIAVVVCIAVEGDVDVKQTEKPIKAKL